MSAWRTEEQMRAMVLLKATEDSEQGIRDGQATGELFKAMGKFNEDLLNAGVMISVDASSSGDASRQRGVLCGDYGGRRGRRPAGDV